MFMTNKQIFLIHPFTHKEIYDSHKLYSIYELHYLSINIHIIIYISNQNYIKEHGTCMQEIYVKYIHA